MEDVWGSSGSAKEVHPAPTAAQPPANRLPTRRPTRLHAAQLGLCFGPPLLLRLGRQRQLALLLQQVGSRARHVHRCKTLRLRLPLARPSGPADTKQGRTLSHAASASFIFCSRPPRGASLMLDAAGPSTLPLRTVGWKSARRRGGEGGRWTAAGARVGDAATATPPPASARDRPASLARRSSMPLPMAAEAQDCNDDSVAPQSWAQHPLRAELCRLRELRGCAGAGSAMKRTAAHLVHGGELAARCLQSAQAPPLPSTSSSTKTAVHCSQ